MSALSEGRAEDIKPQALETEKVVPPQEVAEQPVVSEKLKKVQELGFEDVEDEEEAFDRLVQAYRMQGEQQKLLGEQVQAALEELRRQPAQPAQPSQPAAPDKWWNPPEVDLTTVQNYRTPDGGWKPETPIDVRQQAEAAQRYYDKWANDLVRRPNEVLTPIMRQEAKRVYEEMFGQVNSQQREQQAKERIFSENQWLFEKDPVTGKPNPARLSQEGELLNQHFIVAQEKGLSFEDAWDYAHSKHQLAKLLAAQKPPETEKEVAQVNEEKKRELLSRAGGATPNRTGSLPTVNSPTKTQNRNLSFGERFRQQAQRDGVKLG